MGYVVSVGYGGARLGVVSHFARTHVLIFVNIQLHVQHCILVGTDSLSFSIVVNFVVTFEPGRLPEQKSCNDKFSNSNLSFKKI